MEAKLRMELISPKAAREWAKVAAAEKNKLRSPETELNELQTYVNEFLSGHDFHPDTGLPLMAHVMQKAAYFMDPYSTNLAQPADLGGDDDVRFDRTSAIATAYWAAVLTVGAPLHGDFGWRDGRPWMDLVGAIGRHLLAYRCGSYYDMDSHQPHVAHIMANAAFLIEYHDTFPELDNRPSL